MQFESLEPATLLRRYKRFLADVRRDDGSELTVHCPNTGAMTGCAEPGFRVWIAPGTNPKRKYSHSWVLSQNTEGHYICVQSAQANQLVAEALAADRVPELAGYRELRREVAFGEEGSRADFLLSGPAKRCLVEVKSVTLLLGDGLGAFPDAVSARGRKHLRELMSVRRAGDRAVLLFCALHTGIERVAPADIIDAAYGDSLREAMAAGVEVLAYGASIDERGMALERALPVLSRQPA